MNLIAEIIILVQSAQSMNELWISNLFEKFKNNKLMHLMID